MTTAAPVVLICVPCLLVGGTEMHTVALAKTLRAAGYRLCVCAYFEHDPVMVRAVEATGAQVRLLGLDRNGAGRNIGRMPRLAAALAQVIREERPEFVHVQYMTPGLVPVLVARAMGVRHVLATVHVPGHHYGRRLWLPRSIVARICDAFLCVSQAAERSFFGDSATFDERWLARGRKHFTITNCVDLDEVDRIRATTDVTALRAKLGLNGQPVVGMMSRLSPEKGPQYLIEAMAVVFRAVPTARLLMVGDGAQRPELVEQAKRLGISDRIVWAGRLPREKAWRHMAAMDVVAMPSRWEGFGLSAAEAMAFGKPVVACAATGLTEVVENGVSGLVVPIGDVRALSRATISLLAQDGLRSKMGNAGRRRVEDRFCYRAFADSHLRLYRALSAGPRTCAESLEAAR